MKCVCRVSNGPGIDNNYLLLFHFRVGLKRDMLFAHCILMLL